MIKLTDLQGAWEAFSRLDVTPIHLEVDVEAMKQSNASVSEYYSGYNKALEDMSTNIPKWARLVRK